MQRSALAALAGLAVLALASVAYWMHGAMQERTEQRKVLEALGETTGELRRALAAAPPASLIASLDAKLQAAQAPSSPELAEAAEVYIVSAREIARRRIEIERLERAAAASRAGLEAHMRRGARRNDAWFRDALELKRRVEHDHFELDLALKTLDELLYQLPEAEKKLAPHVATALLLEEAERRQAREAAQLEAQRAETALQRVRALAVR